jgi:hypothetical protein
MAPACGVCGDFWGKRGPVEGVAADPRYLDIWVPPGKQTLPVETERVSSLRLRLVPFCVAAVRCAH